MANEEHLAVLKQGVGVWNNWREENPEIVPDLCNASLRYENLRTADFNWVDLNNADLHGADMRGVTFIGASLTKANLSGANLRGAKLINASICASNLNSTDLRGADFRDADLSWVDLRGADLGWANLERTNMRDARAGYTTFAGTDLSKAKGLETIVHTSPSTLGISAIYLSRGSIPIAFLKGAGVPDDMIAYVQSIMGAIQFYSCFISHSSKDQEFAERLHVDLQAKGVRCWFAPHDVQGGRKLHEQIDQAIRMYDKLLLILSKDSMESTWVNTEIYNARQRELKEGKQMLFPVSLVPFTAIQEWKSFDADSGKDLAREIREYYLPDFSNWKDHDSYQKAFDRLLRDLKA